MQAMAYRRNAVFSAGIVWDPREPMPPELQDDREVFPHYPDGTAFVALNAHYDATHFPARNLSSTPGRIAPLPNATVRKVAAVNPGTGTGRRAVPSFTVQEHNRNVLPPLSVSVDVSIVQDTASVSVTQLFWNDADAPIKEAAFTFPLPAGCTVTDFSCRIGTDKIIKGTIKPREEAREAFRHHIRHHDTAAGLLEQDTPEIFTTSLGNLPERTKISISLNYITLLKHHFADSKNVASLTIPTSIAPRYGEAPEGYNDAATTDISRGLTLGAEIIESESITSITSPSHAITVARRHGTRVAESFADLAGSDDRSKVETASVQLQSGSIMYLDRDFVLDIVTAPKDGSEGPQAWLEQHPTLANHKALMLTLPSGYLMSAAPRMQRSEILFLADLSGSMEDKIIPLKSAMQFFLKGIPEERKFNLWCFGDNYKSWRPSSVEYDKATLDSALLWVGNTFRADMGGTNLLPALQAIVDASDKTLLTDIIILTDGETWYLEQTLDYIQKTRVTTGSRIRFFALGIGKAVSHALVDGIAKTGGGYAEVVQDESQEGWEDRVVSMTKAALTTAHIGPLRMVFDLEDENGNQITSSLVDAQRSPADVSALNLFDRARLYFLYDAADRAESIKHIRIAAMANQEAVSLVVPVTTVEKPDDKIHKLAARSVLEDLERGRSHIHLGPNRPYPGSWDESDTVRKEAERVACKWSLLSKWTSFFLAEERPSPPKDDTPMGGVVEVKTAPGDDLLQPVGVGSQWCSDPLSMPRLSDFGINAGSIGNTFTPLGTLGRTDKRRRSLRLMLDFEGTASACPPVYSPPSAYTEPWGCDAPRQPNLSTYSIGETRHSRRRREREELAVARQSSAGEREGPARRGGTAPSSRVTDFISAFLQFQEFDGSIDFGDWATATALLGPGIAKALQKLQAQHAGLDFKVVCTAAVRVLLKRNFWQRESLWELMDAKAASYLDKHPLLGGEDLLEVVKEALRGLRLPRRVKAQWQPKPTESAEPAGSSVIFESATAAAPQETKEDPEPTPSEVENSGGIGVKPADDAASDHDLTKPAGRPPKDSTRTSIWKRLRFKKGRG